MLGSWWCFCVVKNQTEGVSNHNEVFFINESFAYQEIQKFFALSFTNLREFNHLEWIEDMNIFMNFSSLFPLLFF